MLISEENIAFSNKRKREVEPLLEVPQVVLSLPLDHLSSRFDYTMPRIEFHHFLSSSILSECYILSYKMTGWYYQSYVP